MHFLTADAFFAIHRKSPAVSWDASVPTDSLVRRVLRRWSAERHAWDCGSSRGAAGNITSRRQQEFGREPVRTAALDYVVVPSAVEQLRHCAGERAGAILPVDALIMIETLDNEPALAGDFVKDLYQAGVVCFDAQVPLSELDRRRMRKLLGGRNGRWRDRDRDDGGGRFGMSVMPRVAVNDLVRGWCRPLDDL